MKALAVFPKTKKIQVIDHPEPAIERPNQVKLRMLEVGICGTDKEIAAFEYGTPPDGSDYLVIGHEGLGEVTEVGPEVTRFKVGDLVVPMVRRPCLHAECAACRAGRQDFCYTGDFKERGIKQYHGFITEYVVDEEQYMNLVPRELRGAAVLTEPLTIAEKAMVQMWDIQQRLPWACPVKQDAAPAHCHRAVVLGAGPVGLLGAMVLRQNGFNTYVYSRKPKPNLPADVAELLGAVYISSEEIVPDQLAEHTGAIDLVYEAVGASSFAFDVIRELGPNAVFIFTGVPGRKGPIQVDTDLIMRDLVLNNQVLFGSVNAGRISYETAITNLGDYVKRWPQAVQKMITGYYKMEDFETLLLGNPPGIKNVIKIAEMANAAER